MRSSRATRLARRLIPLMLCLAASRAGAQGQLRLTASNTATSGTVPTPLRAQYQSATTESLAASGGWTLRLDCGNDGDCFATVRLQSLAADALTSLKVTYTIPTDNKCNTVSGTIVGSNTKIVNSATAIDLFGADKNQDCTITITSIVVNNMSYTRYQSSATANTLYTQGLVFGWR